MQDHNKIFEDLFVLELANNHWGSVERGLKIIQQFSGAVRFSNVRAAIKLQFRDVDAFVHKDFKEHTDIRYVKKTLDTKLSEEQFSALVKAIKIPVACRWLPLLTSARLSYVKGLIFRLSRSPVRTSTIGRLIERIAHTRRPVIISSGGASDKNLDDVVRFFGNRQIPLAINHCVSLYPSEDHELELNQIDYLRERYPDHVIGFSTHEYHDWSSSMLISYAKGARTWERHIDIDADGIPVAPYCSLPHQATKWFSAYHKAREMCLRRVVSGGLPNREIQYLDNLVRGVYARRDLPSGYEVNHTTFNGDFYLAFRCRKGNYPAGKY